MRKIILIVILVVGVFLLGRIMPHLNLMGNGFVTSAVGGVVQH